MDFATLREEVWWANVQLPAAGLVVMHSGNVSGIDREHGLALIKPSGVDYDTLRPDDLVAVDLQGERVAETPDGVVSPLRPSVDTPHHVALYRGDEAIGGVIHTHSNYATAWAAAGIAIPCGLTAMADEFGGEIPCAPYASNERNAIGEAILSHRTRAPGILLANHGVFAFDATPRKALKAAAMIEDAAKTMWLATRLGDVPALPRDEIEKWWDRYHETYGQVSR
jgi:L-ribulose-5-phosphate 4-epimerase